jgi:hypothetical protein
MTPREKLLYDQVTAYLLEPQLFAFRGNQRRLILIGFHRLMGSSIAALTASLRKVAARLDQILQGHGPDHSNALLDDLEDEDLQVESESAENPAVDLKLVEKELDRVRSFISLAETLHRDSKAEKLLDVIRVIAERAPKANPTVYPGAPEATKFGEFDAGFVAVVFFPRHGKPPIVQKQPVGGWRWRDERIASLAELERLRAEDLRDCVVRLTLSMAVSLAEFERIEKILNELRGNEATHGRAGVLQVNRAGLTLNTDVGDLEKDLPDVLKSVVQRLQARAGGQDGVVARQALYHLYKAVRSLPNRAAPTEVVSTAGDRQ